MSSTLDFYYNPQSTAWVTQAVLDVLDVPHNIKQVTFASGILQSPEFLALNPAGKIPTIVHNGTPVFESAAITLYLGEAFGVEKGLFPAAGGERGQAMSWITWAYPSITKPASGMMRAKDEERKTYLTELLKNLAVLDTHLEGKEWIVGKEYSLVDTHLYAFVRWVRMLNVDISDKKNVSAWLEKADKKNLTPWLEK